MENTATTKMEFRITINATPQKVWDVLWNDTSYRKWTAVFAEGSHIKGILEEGAEIRFVNESGEGMLSRVHRMDPPAEMDFEHLGELQEGKLVPKEWAGVHERYLIHETDNGTVLEITMDTNESFRQYFEDTFPKAIALVKEMSEEG